MKPKYLAPTATALTTRAEEIRFIESAIGSLFLHLSETSVKKCRLAVQTNCTDEVAAFIFAGLCNLALAKISGVVPSNK